jgi:CHASE3 domain sensor protein
MTDLTAAREYLEQYQAALGELRYYASRIETLCSHCGRSLK